MSKRPRGKKTILSCSPDKAATLIRDVGFDPVDAGPLRNARYTEPFALLVAGLAYGGTEGPELAYRFEQFGRRG